MALSLYASSAGSGKTYTLARSYIELALRNPGQFHRILAVTFTNKATEEMKARILTMLQDLGDDRDSGLLDHLSGKLRLSATEVKARSKSLLSNLLHAYQRFAVVTIDSFFHQVIRIFARELGLQTTFQINLDVGKVLDEVIDDLLASLDKEGQAQIREWLKKFALAKLNDGKHWDFKGDLLRLANEMVKDAYMFHADRLSSLGADKGFYSSFLKEVDGVFDVAIKRAREALRVIDTLGGVDVFKNKSRGPVGVFFKTLKKDYVYTDTQKKAQNDITGWLKKEELANNSLVGQIEQKVWPHYNFLVDQQVRLNSYAAVKEFFYAFGILTQVAAQLEEYRRAHDVLLISDLTDFLQRIIRDSDTPYIYERVGSHFEHYLIDEFQDTSAMQWRNFSPLIEDSLASGRDNLIVGDVKQSIYRWRGGDWRLLTEGLDAQVGPTHRHQLNNNWRSSPTIVEFNNAVFSEVAPRSNRLFASISNMDLVREGLQAYDPDQVRQVAQKDVSGCVQLRFLDPDNWEEDALKRMVQTIEEAQEHGFRLSDMAILVRKQSEGRKVANYIMRYKSGDQAKANCRYEVVSSEALYLQSSAAVRLIISFMKFLTNPKDDIVRAEWLHEYVQLTEHPVGTAFPYLDSWKNLLPERVKSMWKTLPTLTLYELVEAIIHGFELNRFDQAYSYLQGFQDAVLDYMKTDKGDIPGFLLWWEEVRKERAIMVSDNNDAIKILTIHKAKGLEYPLVFVPFLSWSLDHEALMDTILWSSPPEQDEVLSQLPLIPLKYKKRLSETYWADVFWEERFNAYLDAINLLYVAFTRPERGLFAYGPKPKQDKQEAKNVAEWLFEIANAMPEWDSDEHGLESGTWPLNMKSTAVPNEYALSGYPTGTWRDRLKVKLPLSAEDPRSIGLSWHEELERVKLRSEALDIRPEVVEFLDQPQILPWYSDLEWCENEVPILLEDGATIRLDRLIRKDGAWILLEFKTGEQSPEHARQVKKYCEVLQRMEIDPLSAFIVYVPSGEIIPA